jgi:DnaJ-domain-containing protein 1
MIDCFKLLDEPRRAWLDPESLKTKFLALTTELHPDRVHGSSVAEKEIAQQRFAELNSAYNCLREPKDRLRHFLELELGRKPAEIQQVPEHLMEMFFEVSRVCRETDEFMAQRAAVTSPLLKVQWFERTQELVERLSEIQRMVAQHREGLLGEIQRIDGAWTAHPTAVPSERSVQELEGIYRELSYNSRWISQLQERLTQLMI